MSPFEKRAPLFTVALLALLVASATRCAYSPNPDNGTLQCGTGDSCPDGYRCVTAGSGKTCWKNGETPTGTAGTSGGAGQGGTTGAAGTGAAGTTVLPSGANFVGRWIFLAGSTETVSCTDNSTTMPVIVDDYMDVTQNGTTIVEDYFCPWNENLNVTATGTTIRAGQSCSRTSSDATTGTTKFTWHGTTFNMSTLDGKSATLAATVGSDYLKDASKTGCGPNATVACTGTCTIMINGSLGKCPGVGKPNCTP
jgi:hypothetical protein